MRSRLAYSFALRRTPSMSRRGQAVANARQVVEHRTHGSQQTQGFRHEQDAGNPYNRYLQTSRRLPALLVVNQQEPRGLLEAQRHRFRLSAVHDAEEIRQSAIVHDRCDPQPPRGERFANPTAPGLPDSVLHS